MMQPQYDYVEMPADAGPGMYYPPATPHYDSKADLLDKINPEKIVDSIAHRLMGEVFINGKWTKIDTLKKRALTKLGSWDIANLLLGVSSQNVSISKLNDKEIRERTLNVVKTAQYMCLKNWREYGILGQDQLYFVHQIVMSITFITLKQPEGEGIRKMLMGTIQESRVQSQTDMPMKKGGFLNLFRNRR